MLVDAQGQPLNTRKQIDGQAFTIYGLSEYYRATNNAQAFKLCLELFEWVEKHSFWKYPDHNVRACLEVVNNCKMLLPKE